jgi:hypothetical protein
MQPTRAASLAVLAVAVAGCGGGANPLAARDSTGVARLVVAGDGIARPDPALTPGAALAGLSVVQLCTPGYVAGLPQPSPLTEQSVFEEYNLDYPSSLNTYRLDKLIPAELNGSDSPANLWPEPRGQATAARKDEVAAQLHQLVCAGDVPLTVAQQAMASDWYAAWQTYVKDRSVGSAAPLAAPMPGPLASSGAATGAPATGVVGGPVSTGAGPAAGQFPGAGVAAAPAPVPAPVAPAPVAPVTSASTAPAPPVATTPTRITVAPAPTTMIITPAPTTSKPTLVATPTVRATTATQTSPPNTTSPPVATTPPMATATPTPTKE